MTVSHRFHFCNYERMLELIRMFMICALAIHAYNFIQTSMARGIVDGAHQTSSSQHGHLSICLTGTLSLVSQCKKTRCQVPVIRRWQLASYCRLFQISCRTGRLYGVQRRVRVRTHVQRRGVASSSWFNSWKQTGRFVSMNEITSCWPLRATVCVFVP